MKRNKLLLFPLLVSVFSLASCGPQKDDSKSSYDSSPISVDSATTKKSIATPVDGFNEFGEKLYSLTITGRPELIIRGPFRPSTDIEPTEYSFPKGAWVIFETSIVQNAEVIAKLNGEKLESYQQDINGKYFQFYMPEQDSVIDISVE